MRIAPSLSKKRGSMPKPLSILPELIDSFCELKKAREDFAATESLYQKAFNQVKATLVDAPAGEMYVVSGKQWTLEISERGMDGKIDAKAARKRLGADIFLKVVQITAKALETYLLKPEIEALTIREQTGARKFVATARY